MADNITVKDASAANVTMRAIELAGGVKAAGHVLVDPSDGNPVGYTDMGRQAANQSTSVALSNEDKAALDLLSSNVSSMTVGQQALSTSAVSVRAANAARVQLEIRNNDTSIDVYIGNTGVTSANGFLLRAGQSIIFRRMTAAVFAVAASGTPSVSYVEY